MLSQVDSEDVLLCIICFQVFRNIIGYFCLLSCLAVLESRLDQYLQHGLRHRVAADSVLF